jgi:hypothetical protein
MNDAIENFGEWIEDIIDTVCDSTVWTFIFGAVGIIGLIVGAFQTESIIGGILVVVIGLYIGFYVVTIGALIFSFIARIFLYIFRYIFYNIYTLIIALVITLSSIFGPQILSAINSYSEPRNTKIESVTSVPETTTYYCTANNNLNIRKGPNANAEVIGVLKPGQSVEVYFINGDWATIKYNGSKAFVSAKYISLY